MWYINIYISSYMKEGVAEIFAPFTLAFEKKKSQTFYHMEARERAFCQPIDMLESIYYQRRNMFSQLRFELLKIGIQIQTFLRRGGVNFELTHRRLLPVYRNIMDRYQNITSGRNHFIVRNRSSPHWIRIDAWHSNGGRVSMIPLMFLGSTSIRWIHPEPWSTWRLLWRFPM